MPNLKNNMGINWASSLVFKRTNRFILNIIGVTTGTGQYILNPNTSRQFSVPTHSGIYLWDKASRPTFSIKENEVNHCIETIGIPGRPEYKPLKVTLLDTIGKMNPVVDWVSHYFGMTNSARGFKVGDWFGGNEWAVVPGNWAGKFKRDVTVTALDGQGCPMEEWYYKNAWPSEVDFGEFDMGSQEVMKVNLTLRYERAIWVSSTLGF